MHSHFYEKIKNHPKVVVSLIAVVIISIPLLINGLMYLRFPTPCSLHAPDWLGFWGAYIGGLTGTISGLVALFATYKQAEKHHLDDLENRRLSIMPLLSLDLRIMGHVPQDTADIIWCFWADIKTGFHFQYRESGSEYDDLLKDLHGKPLIFELSNIGTGPATNVTIYYGEYNLLLGGFGAGDKKKYIFIVPFYDGTELKYELAFDDTYGNRYSQVQMLTLLKVGIKIHPFGKLSRINPS